MASSSSTSTPHFVKQIAFNGNTCSIVTQNENGPCALLGLANVLILRSSMSISSTLSSSVSNGDLLDHVSDLLLSSAPDNSTSADTHASKLNSALEFLAFLPWEMEVDVMFTGVTAFSSSPGTDLFSLLGVPLFHTWLVDPSCEDLASVIGNLSYVELNDKVITYKASGEKVKDNEANIAKDFLEMAPNQMMKYGLNQLTNEMYEGQLGVLFRNNHFATIYKKDGIIYQLVTDEGYLSRQDIIWETVVADGASNFVNQDFNHINASNFLNQDFNHINASNFLNQDFNLINNSVPIVKTCSKGHNLALNPSAGNEAEWHCDDCWNKYVGNDLCFRCGLCNYVLCGQCYFKHEDATSNSVKVDYTEKNSEPEAGLVSCPIGHIFTLALEVQLIALAECFACGWKIGSTSSQCYDCPCPYFLCANCYGNQKTYDGWMPKHENNGKSDLKGDGRVDRVDKNKNSIHFNQKERSKMDRNENISVPRPKVKTCPQSHSLRCAAPTLTDWKCYSCAEVYVGDCIVRFQCREADFCNFNMCGNCFYKRADISDVVGEGAKDGKDK